MPRPGDTPGVRVSGARLGRARLGRARLGGARLADTRVGDALRGDVGRGDAWRGAVSLSAASLMTALLLSCGGATNTVDPGVGPPASMADAAGNGQHGVVAMPLATAPAVIVRDDAGRPAPGVTVAFIVTAGGGWVTAGNAATDDAGRAATTWYLGPQAGAGQQLRATAGAGLSVEFSATATPLLAGSTYLGASGFVELRAGELPLIVSAPHGGTLTPSTIPDRSGPDVTTIRDANTDILAGDIADAFLAARNAAPHVIIVNLHRSKLDANREIGEAAEGNSAAERAWREYHGFLEAASQRLVEDHGRGLYIDLHGHGHPIQRLELGYLLTAGDLQQDDATLNSSAFTLRSSMRTLAQAGLRSHAEVIRGPLSLGSLFADRGFPAVPSAEQPHPGNDPYFTGGYNTRRHGSRDGGSIDAVQIESNMTGVRDNAGNRQHFAAVLVDVLAEYFASHYGTLLPSRSAPADARSGGQDSAVRPPLRRYQPGSQTQIMKAIASRATASASTAVAKPRFQ